MKKLLIGFVAGLSLWAASAFGAQRLFTIELFSADLSDAEVIACIRANGDGAVLYDLMEDGNGSYDTVQKGYACVKAAK